MASETQTVIRSAPVRPLLGRVIYDHDGVQAIVRPQSLYIRLPYVSSEEQYPKIFCALQRIYDAGFDNLDWVVDVSALARVPLSLLSVFTSFREELRCNGRRLSLSGISPDAFPPPSAFSPSPLFSRQGLRSLAD